MHADEDDLRRALRGGADRLPPAPPPLDSLRAGGRRRLLRRRIGTGLAAALATLAVAGGAVAVTGDGSSTLQPASTTSTSTSTSAQQPGQDRVPQNLRAREERRRLLQACIDRVAWPDQRTVDLDGGIVEVFQTVPDTVEGADAADVQDFVQDLPAGTHVWTDAEMDHFTEVMSACERELGIGTDAQPPTEAQAREAYRQDVDTWRCLREQGLDLAPPISEEAYVRSSTDPGSGGQFWAPYLDPAVLDHRSEQQIQHLKTLCPERL